MLEALMPQLKENLERVEEAIEAACRRAGRRRGDVELMAVSKTYPAETIAEAARLGLRLFGENRVQEFAGKAGELAPLRMSPVSKSERPGAPGGSFDSAARKGSSGSAQDDGSLGETGPVLVHLIGHLQSNKAAKAAELFDGIDSLDSVRLAERLNEAAGKLDKRLPVLIELKLSPEETKAGVEPESDEAARLLGALPGLDSLECRGLMTIAPWGAAEDVTRACFRSLREWRDRWAKAHPRLNFDVLSMGMSGDFALAIEEGATRVRIGTALFGKRPPMAEQRKAFPEDFAE